MRDGPIRRAIKRVARTRYAVDLWITRRLARANGRPALELGGQCRLCAKCCEAPSIQLGAWAFRSRVWRWCVVRWHALVNGFELVDVEPRAKVLVFRCTHFDWETRRCDSYDSRPGMCRDYPRNLLDHPRPGFLEGCGYFALSANRERLQAIFDAEGLPPEKRAKIDEVFYLRGGEKGETTTRDDTTRETPPKA